MRGHVSARQISRLCINKVHPTIRIITRTELRVRTPLSWRSGHLDIPPGIDLARATSRRRSHSRQFRRQYHTPNMVRYPSDTATSGLRGLGADRCPLGCPRRLHLHPRGQGGPVEAVPRDAAVPDRSAPSILPQAGGQRDPAHDGRAGQRPIRLPAPRRALHGPDHEQAIQHPAGHRLAPPLRAGGLQHMQEPR